jgi:hypothetical protein
MSRGACRSGNGASPAAGVLRLDMAAALLPHPQKADRGGEDAVFLGDDNLSFGKRRASHTPCAHAHNLLALRTVPCHEAA